MKKSFSEHGFGMEEGLNRKEKLLSGYDGLGDWRYGGPYHPAFERRQLSGERRRGLFVHLTSLPSRNGSVARPQYTRVYDWKPTHLPGVKVPSRRGAPLDQLSGNKTGG